jgi:RNA polymerase sigma-70 factor, ECF subfamily
MDMAHVAETPEPDTSDQEFVRRSRSGDRASFERIVLRYEQRVYGACRSLLRDREDAIDVVQETFLRAFLSIGKLRDDAHLAGWLCGIALTLCKARRRRTLRRHRLWESRPAPPKPAEAAETRPLEECLRRLPDEQRVAVGLRFHAQLSHGEVAVAMGVSLTSAKRLVHQGLLALRELMGQEDAR